MDIAWKILCAAGLPDGAVRPAGTMPAREDVLDALTTVAARLEDLSLRDRELLFAWLRAYRQHWPVAFETTLGPLGEQTLRALDGDLFDSNRYLKLRRIAIANLAGAVNSSTTHVR